MEDMESTRQKKISRLLQRELSEMFLKEAKALTIGTMVSVSQVRISPDLGLAKVYISIFPSEKKNEVYNEVNTHNSLMRRNLGLRVGKQLRVVPELQFYIDDSLDYIDNIDRLLKE
jgi:ribosome-binding factor A